MFKNPFSFNGRIRRLEYGLSILIIYAYIILISFIVNFPLLEDHVQPSETSVLLFLLGLIPAYWFAFAQAAKRCHDRDNSGWFQLIPFYGFWLLFADGFPGKNQYGPNPKGIGNIDEIDQIGNYLQ
ncbi:MAG: DUF805 domain-containing protein [Chitinophagaceae bacterium]|jgi:uncharacterized membrane protein YhaH (DUF805 family)|nr:DUF805 domain-containing protein [Chitinophagaceae bacterium]MBP6046943.1 DUF805 domain-containing protein [Ferruginibacter sp.]MBK7088295.1 DUF805 domain-containing protein [Chitinophagaceae bacterium]MBK7347051.1 DUF805 domain-containing protein [Chitinophagaceae bacterium]MBK7735047.1 DUF805 domain-containing protein [Chitinophagaceae bacterium]